MTHPITFRLALLALFAALAWAGSGCPTPNPAPADRAVPPTPPPADSGYRPHTDHDKFLSGMFPEEFVGQKLRTRLYYWETDTQMPWGSYYRGMAGYLWILAYPEDTYRFLVDWETLPALEKASKANDYSKRILQRYVIPVAPAYRHTLLGLPRGSTLDVDGTVVGFTDRKYLLRADRLEVSGRP
ncbi:MAG: hypothetical protein JNL97_07715 [Verrucomicrobiales bacterium]|nr:hypothetical protein [Verrucomicrobiales bacterium]